jgi:hypothetical protein
MPNGAQQSNPQETGAYEEALGRDKLIAEVSRKYGITRQEADAVLDGLEKVEVADKLFAVLADIRADTIEHSDVFDKIDQEETGTAEARLFIGNFPGDRAENSTENDTMTISFPLDKPDPSTVPLPRTENLWSIEGKPVVAIADLKKRGNLYSEERKASVQRILSTDTFFILSDGTVFVSRFDYQKRQIAGDEPVDDSSPDAILKALFDQKSSIDKRKVSVDETRQLMDAISGAEVMPSIKRDVYDISLLVQTWENFRSTYESGKMSADRYEAINQLFIEAFRQLGGKS